MTRPRKLAVLAALAVVASWSTAGLRAAEITVEDSRCSALKAEDLTALEKRLKDAKAIGPDDKIVCKPGDKKSISEKNLNPLAILPAIAAAACSVRNALTRSECAKISVAADRKQCQDDEAKRYKDTRSACK